MFDLSGKCALVTGASGGIGGAIARALHAQGAKVTLAGTRRDAPLSAERVPAQHPKHGQPESKAYHHQDPEFPLAAAGPLLANPL